MSFKRMLAGRCEGGRYARATLLPRTCWHLLCIRVSFRRDTLADWIGGAFETTATVFQSFTAMRLIEMLENRKEALKVSEVAKILGFTPQHIYKMAKARLIPCFHVKGAVAYFGGSGNLGKGLSRGPKRAIG
jgi:hypothetical protein